MRKQLQHFIKASTLVFLATIFLLSSFLNSCWQGSSANMKPADETKPLADNLVPGQPDIAIGVVDDRSGSFKNQAEVISSENLDPLKEFFTTRKNSQLLLVSFIKDNSNKMLLRYTDVNRVPVPPATEKDVNTWEDKSSTPRTLALRTNREVDSVNKINWDRFIGGVGSVTTKPLYNYSDVKQAFERVIIGLNEYTSAKRYLIVQTDFKDTNTGMVYTPKIPDDVEVLVVGNAATIPPSLSKYKKFEAFSSAVRYIINNNP